MLKILKKNQKIDVKVKEEYTKFYKIIQMWTKKLKKKKRKKSKPTIYIKNPNNNNSKVLHTKYKI